MKLKTTLIAAAAGLLCLSPAVAKSPVEGAAKPAKQCFWSHQVNSFASNDNRIVNVRVGIRDVYQFEMFGRCMDVDWAQQIALVSRSGSNNICTGLDADIIAPSTIGSNRCPVRNIRKLTAEEIKALPKRSRP